jgi:hypothetical protein
MSMSDVRNAAQPVDAPAVDQTAGGPMPQEDPGRTLGMVGLVLSIVASWIGLIISIVAMRRSKRAGFRNGLAKAGVIIGSITTALGLIGGGIAVVAAVHLASTCSDLGPGVHRVGSGTVTCG